MSEPLNGEELGALFARYDNVCRCKHPNIFGHHTSCPVYVEMIRKMREQVGMTPVAKPDLDEYTGFQR